MKNKVGQMHGAPTQATQCCAKSLSGPVPVSGTTVTEMGIALTKDSIDLGIVVADIDAALTFYRDTLGFTDAGTMEMPGGGVMHRLMCGPSMIKLVDPGRELETKAPRGGIQGAYGYRYWTISVSNIEELTASVGSAGYKVVVPVTALRPGITIAIVVDPDGNWVEFLQA